MAPNRLIKEYREVHSGPPDPDIDLSLADETDIHGWIVMLRGPAGTPYEARAPPPRKAAADLGARGACRRS